MTSHTFAETPFDTPFAPPYVAPDMEPATSPLETERRADLKGYTEEYGWQFTPLDGKRPVKTAWPTNPATMAELEVHIGNIGLITGVLSGIDVLDLDIDPDTGKLPKESDALLASLPITPMVKTGRGGIHAYFTHAEGVGNKAGTIGKHIDVRGHGGQVVFPGSIHPDTKKPYKWMVGCSPADVTVAPWPKDLLDKMTVKPAPPGLSPASVPRSRPVEVSGVTSAYGSKALANECDAVRTALEGSRNATLNTAACKIGALVAGGQIDEPTATNELKAAGADAGLAEGEIVKTIKSGLTKGMQTPRVPDARPTEGYAIPGMSLKPSASVATVEEWPDPAVLGGSLSPVLPFRAEYLPVALRGWVADIAERLQAPPEYAAGAAMTIAGALIGRQLGLKPGKFDDWMVVPNFWCFLVGPPSAMKSPSLSQVRKPLDRLEGIAAAEYGAAMAQHKKHVAVVDAKTKKAKKDLQDSVNDVEQSDLQAEFLAGSIPDAPAPPVCRRYFTSDSTTEKIIELMRDNPRGILILRDELVAFLESLDRAGREGDRAFYCEAWNALGAFTQDRIGRGSIRTEACCASVLGCGTPGRMRSYVAEALADGDGADGFLQRFQILLWPDVSEEWRRVDRWPDSPARDLAYEAMTDLSRIDLESVGAERDKYDLGGGVPFLRFAPDAQVVWDAWYSEHMNRVRKDKDEHPAFISHLAKMQKTVAAIALTCHVLDSGHGPVTLDALGKALAWYELLESHAKRLYGAGASMDMTAARRLWRKIKQGCLSAGFTAREVYRKGWAGLSEDAVRGGLKELEALGYLRDQTIYTGGKAKTIFTVNPKAEVVYG